MAHAHLQGRVKRSTRGSVAPHSDSIVKQPSLNGHALRSRERKSRASFGRCVSICSLQKREQSAAKAHSRMPALCEGQGRPCEAGSPYGAPLRRLKSLVPHCLRPELAGGEGVRTLTLGLVMRREAALQGLPGPRSAKPRAQAPLPIHVRIRSRRTPLSWMGMIRLYIRDEIMSIDKLYCHCVADS